MEGGLPKILPQFWFFFPIRMKIHQATVWQSEHVCLGATVDLSICDMYGILVPHFIKYLHFITVQTVCFDYGNLCYICLQLALQGLSVGWEYEKNHYPEYIFLDMVHFGLMRKKNRQNPEVIIILTVLIVSPLTDWELVPKWYMI